MKFLLTNDDGIGGPGLAAMERLFSEFGTCTVVAPRDEHSGCGHQATHRRLLTPQQLAEGRIALDGFPVDCVRLGLTQFEPDADWVISGINPGGNLGADLYMSGTVAAAREAAFLGRPGLAISQLLKPSFVLEWDAVIERLRPLVTSIFERELNDRQFWNLNLPCPEDPAATLELIDCEPDQKPMDVRYKREGEGFLWTGVYRERGRTQGCDFDVCASGGAALSRVTI